MRGQRVYKGLDCSGPNHVMPPTFEGVKNLVARVGYEGAIAASIGEEEPETQETDMFDEFMTELRYCDKVDRIQITREFKEYVGSLEEQVKKQSTDLRESKADKGEGGTPDPKETKESEVETKE